MAQTFTFIAETNHRKAGSLGAAFIEWLIANPKSDRNAIKAGGHDLKHLRWDLEHNAEKFLVEGEVEVKVAKAAKQKNGSALTKGEAKVMAHFDTYDRIEDTLTDLGVSWTDAPAIAEKAKLNIRTVKGLLGSLTKKDFVQTCEESGAICLTDLGAHYVHDQKEINQFEEPEELEQPAIGIDAPEELETELTQEQFDDLLTSEDQFEAEVDRSNELSSKPVTELRKMASEAKVKNYGKMSKADLVTALAAI